MAVKGLSTMSTRLVRGTVDQQGRNIFVHPRNSMPRCSKKYMYSLIYRSTVSGLQLVYTDEVTAAEVAVVRDGDTILLPEGYHPNVAIPGAVLNFVWIMAAHREVTSDFNQA
jgi:5-deoxy-D-glucuronate isomerase